MINQRPRARRGSVALRSQVHAARRNRLASHAAAVAFREAQMDAHFDELAEMYESLSQREREQLSRPSAPAANRYRFVVGGVTEVEALQRHMERERFWLEVESRRGYSDRRMADVLHFTNGEQMPSLVDLPVALCNSDAIVNDVNKSESLAFDFDEGEHRISHLKLERSALAARPGPRVADCSAA